MLLQIEDPNRPSQPDTIETAIGIDLGTTHSLAFYRDPESGDMVDLAGLVPSVVSVSPHDITVTDAENSPDHMVLRSFKRLMGRSLEDISSTHLKDHFQDLSFCDEQALLRIQTPQGALSAIKLSAAILKHLKHRAEEHLKTNVTKAVITVPAYFDDAARTATKAAAQMAGLDVLRLVNEPTAAALAYGLDTGDKGLYGIYDLGGGTFDFSILKLHRGVFQVIATSGDGHLGGDDIDHALLTHFQIPISRETLQQARHAKETLSTKAHAMLCNHRVTKADLAHAAKPLIEKTLAHCLTSCQEANIEPQDLDGIVLVGGSTKLDTVHTAITETFAKQPLSSIDPDRTVAQGAALQAHALTHGSDTLLMDVTPLSLGIEMMGGVVDRIIERNTPLPTSKAKEFTTYQDNQTGLVIHIVQGERELATDCRSLGTFTLRGIPPMVAGAARVQVTLTVDTDGLLSVQAKEETTGIQQNIAVKPSFGLSEDEMKHMILSSLDHAKDDVEARLLAESKVEAKRFLEALLPALAQDKSLLTDQEFQDLQTKLDDLDAALKTEHRDTIETCVKDLEQVTTTFAERRMGQTIKKALEGKSLDTVQQALD